jgi:hypothetical protein
MAFCIGNLNHFFWPEKYRRPGELSSGADRVASCVAKNVFLQDLTPSPARRNPVQAAKAYDSVRDTFSKIGVPTEEQTKAYIAMLSSTASLKGDVAAGSIFDFSLAAEAARELAQKK